MNALSQPRKSGFSPEGVALILILTIIPFFGDAQIARCALVDFKTQKEIDVKNGFKASEVPAMKVIVVGGNGEYRIDMIETTQARLKDMILVAYSSHSPYVARPYNPGYPIQAGDRLIVKVLAIFLKKPDGTEEKVKVNNMQFVIPIL